MPALEWRNSCSLDLENVDIQLCFMIAQGYRSIINFEEEKERTRLCSASWFDCLSLDHRISAAKSWFRFPPSLMTLARSAAAGLTKHIHCYAKASRA